MQKVRVKICCIQNSHEASLAIAYGASAIGLVSAMPSGPGVISEDQIGQITAQAVPAIGTFLLTSQQTSAAIIEQQRRCGVNTLQLVDRVGLDVYPALRDALPGVSLVQVIHVRDETAIDEACRVAPYVNGLLLDSGNPHLPIKQLGGTGRRHDWNISHTICNRVDKPVFLAGGLNPANVAEAIETVHPFGVDICSGVRTNGLLDEQKLAACMEAIS